MTTQTEHRINGIDMDLLQKTVADIEQDPELGKCKFRARNKWMEAAHNRTAIAGFFGARQEIPHKQRFELHADEPVLLAGQDEAPNPVEHLLNALAACLTTTLVAHAAVRGIHIEELESDLEGDIDLRGFFGLADDVPKGYTNIRVTFRIKSDEHNLDRLKKLTEFSPVFNTVTQGAKVDVRIESK
ncbi:MAG TPA: osmotically inducible protein C [Verrucomicrobia bacterium]|nr:MAG: osmotically inducible protein C [Lentisphaerae bacterium GWF2_57_35]HBA86396.1 osmotically inducible protein C [Verrucomicrobiota bacterium]